MKSALISMIMFQSTSTLVAYLINKERLLEAGVISAICIIAYVVGELIIRKDFKKEDVKIGVFLGVFMGLLSQICQYYWVENSGFITVGLIVICLFPKRVFNIFLRAIARKFDKL